MFWRSRNTLTRYRSLVSTDSYEIYSLLDEITFYLLVRPNMALTNKTYYLEALFIGLSFTRPRLPTNIDHLALLRDLHIVEYIAHEPIDVGLNLR